MGTSGREPGERRHPLTIAAGVATFTAPSRTTSEWVTDLLRRRRPTYAYISGRISPTQYTVTDRLGAVPPNVGAATAVNSIMRAFNSLTTAGVRLQRRDPPGHGEPRDRQLPAQLDLLQRRPHERRPSTSMGYTTDATRYIRVYTPTSSGEVGVSQRHSGVFGTGFQLNAPTNAPDPDLRQLRPHRGPRHPDHRHEQHRALGRHLGGYPPAASDVRISHNIIKGVITGGAAGPAGSGRTAARGRCSGSGTTSSTTSPSTGWGISLDHGSGYVFNNTVYNCKIGIGAGLQRPGRGEEQRLDQRRPERRLRRLLPARRRRPHATTCPRTRRLGDRTPDRQDAYATYFKNTTSGTEDLHITNTSLALWGSSGANLSADANLPVTDDIDGGPRVRPDIGADELAAVPVYYSVGTAAGPLYSANASATSGVLTLASAAANNVGVGDEIRRGADRTIAPCYYITGRVSPTVFTIQNSAAFGGTPGATNITFASTAITIRPAFNLLSTAESNPPEREPPEHREPGRRQLPAELARYNDCPMNDQVSISGYTTSAVGFIKVYRLSTPTRWE